MVIAVLGIDLGKTIYKLCTAPESVWCTTGPV